MEKILKYSLAIIIAMTIYSCDINGPGTATYSDRAGNELMSYNFPDQIIDKKGVYLFQLESIEDDTVSYYDSDVQGTDVTKIEFKERFLYTYRIGDVDSITVSLHSSSGEELFKLDSPFESTSFLANAGTYTLKVKNNRASKGVRNIFVKPDYDTISTFSIFNANNDIIYSIISEDECVSCSFIDANMIDFELDRINFTDANFQNANLQGSDLSYSVLNYVSFLSTKVDSADLSYTLFDKPKDLRHSTFYNTKMTGIQIRDANINFSKFYDCDLSYSLIENCTYNVEGDMFACNLKNSEIINNDFSNGQFEFCRFDSSDITGTNFCESLLKDATFFKTVGDETTTCVPDSARGTKTQ